MLFIHIVIALSSVVSATHVLLSPNKKWLQISYVLVGLTLATGTYLVMENPAHMVRACISGIIYVGFIVSGLAHAGAKLARLKPEYKSID